MAELKDQSRDVSQELLSRLIKETVDALVEDDRFIEKLSTRLAYQLSGGTTGPGVADNTEVSYWEVTISDHALNDKSFRIFIELGEGPVTPERLQFVDTQETVRSDIVAAVLDHVNTGDIAPGKLHWVNLSHVTTTPAV